MCSGAGGETRRRLYWLGLAEDTYSLRGYGTWAEIGGTISRTAFAQLRHSIILLVRDRRGNDSYLFGTAHFALHGHRRGGYRSGRLASDDDCVLAHAALLRSIATPDALAPADRSFLPRCDSSTPLPVTGKVAAVYGKDVSRTRRERETPQNSARLPASASPCDREERRIELDKDEGGQCAETGG